MLKILESASDGVNAKSIEYWSQKIELGSIICRELSQSESKRPRFGFVELLVKTEHINGLLHITVVFNDHTLPGLSLQEDDPVGKYFFHVLGSAQIVAIFNKFEESIHKVQDELKKLSIF